MGAPKRRKGWDPAGTKTKEWCSTDRVISLLSQRCNTFKLLKHLLPIPRILARWRILTQQPYAVFQGYDELLICPFKCIKIGHQFTFLGFIYKYLRGTFRVRIFSQSAFNALRPLLNNHLITMILRLLELHQHIYFYILHSLELYAPLDLASLSSFLKMDIPWQMQQHLSSESP